MHHYVQLLQIGSHFILIISLDCSAKPVTTWPWAIQCDMGCDDGMVIPRE